MWWQWFRWGIKAATSLALLLGHLVGDSGVPGWIEWAAGTGVRTALVQQNRKALQADNISAHQGTSRVWMMASRNMGVLVQHNMEVIQSENIRLHRNTSYGWRMPCRNMGALVQQNMEALQAENIRASATNMDLASATSRAASIDSTLDFDPHVPPLVCMPHHRTVRHDVTIFGCYRVQHYFNIYQ